MKSEILVVSYNGLLEESRILSLIISIPRQIEIIREKKIKAVMVSLNGAKYDESYAGAISFIIKKLNELSEKLKIVIALVDYSIPLYKHLIKYSKHTQVKLFKSTSAARIFLDPKSYKSDLRILVYDEDDENRIQLSKTLSKYGYTIVTAKDAKEFQLLVNEKSSDVIITHSSLNVDSNAKNAAKTHLTLSKKLIMNLPVFMDTAVETLVSFTGLDAAKSAHSIKSFELGSVKDIYCAIMSFSGDIEGSFALLFPKDIALVAMESLLGEKIDENDSASIMDGIGEFCNVITGSAKTAFSSKAINVLFDLPKTYNSPESIRSEIGNNNGVWIDMQLAGKPFYMFITK